MNILMVNKFLYPAGGAEKYMIDLGKYLSSQGHIVEYFGMDNEKRTLSNSANIYVNQFGFDDGIIKSVANSLKTIYSKEAYNKLCDVIRRFNPDIIHMNNINYQLTPSVIYAAKNMNVPMVQTVHDVQMACPNHMMYIEQTDEVCSRCLDGNYTHCIKNKCVHSSRAKSVIACLESTYYHRKNTYNLADAYICPSRFMADTIKKAGVDEKRIIKLQNFVISPAADEKSAKSENPYILYFGRVSVEKGIKTLINVMKTLPDIRLVIAGDGPLKNLCTGVDNIDAVGFKSGAELQSLIANARFCVYPSEWYENCPITVLESIAAGTPIIVSDLGGSVDLIDEGKTGISFRARDEKQLADIISSLWSDSEKLSYMTEQCTNAELFGIKEYGKQLIEIYNTAIKERRNQSNEKTAVKNHK